VCESSKFGQHVTGNAFVKIVQNIKMQNENFLSSERYVNL